MQTQQLLTALPLALAAGMAISQDAQASTILTGSVDTNIAIPVDHGSNATETPNVALAWTGVWEGYAGWPNDGGDGIYQLDDYSDLSISFAPEAGYAVTIESFELNEWNGGGNTTVDWTVTGSVSGLIASGVFDLFNTANDPSDQGGSGLVSPNVQGADGELLTLSFTRGDGSGEAYYLAMDNLSFSQVAVPEPAGLALMAGGLLAVGARRRAR